MKFVAVHLFIYYFSLHRRVGWSCRYSRLDVPIGFDQFSVCIRDVDGSVIQSAKRRTYADTHLGENVHDWTRTNDFLSAWPKFRLIRKND